MCSGRVKPLVPCRAMGADIGGTARLKEVQLPELPDRNSQNPGFCTLFEYLLTRSFASKLLKQSRAKSTR